MSFDEFIQLAETMLEEGVVDHCETTKEARTAFNEALKNHATILDRLDPPKKTVPDDYGGWSH